MSIRRPTAGTVIIAVGVVIAVALVVGFVLNQLEARDLFPF